MGPYFMGMTKRKSRQHSQAEWREIAYRQYVRERDGGEVPDGAQDRASQWVIHDPVAEMLRFEARYHADAQAEDTRQQSLRAAREAKLAKLTEILRAQAAQLPLFEGA